MRTFEEWLSRKADHRNPHIALVARRSLKGDLWAISADSYLALVRAHRAYEAHVARTKRAWRNRKEQAGE